MNKISLILLSLILFIGCDGNNIINSGSGYERIYLDNIDITIDHYLSNTVYFDITNNGTFTIPQEWASLNKIYITADIYTDSTMTNFCSTEMSYCPKTIEPGETTHWAMYGLCGTIENHAYIEEFKVYQILDY